MSKPQVKEHNIETGEVIVRDMTDAELTNYEAFQAAELQKIEDAKAAKIARDALLARLGITEEEAILLLGGTN
jgi:hypothetical protein